MRTDMRPTLRTLTALLCAVAACAEVTPVRDFNLDQMTGKWYTVGLSSNAQWFVDNKATMKMGTSVIASTAGGDMDVSYATLNHDGTCWRMTYLAKKTDTPGRFTFSSQRWNNENDVRVVDVQYDVYALLHTIKTQNGVSTIVNQLYSRGPEVSAVLQEKFRQLSLKTGVLPENISILPKNAECPAV